MLRYATHIILVLSFVAITSCSAGVQMAAQNSPLGGDGVEDGGGGGDVEQTAAPAAPGNVQLEAGSHTTTITWDSVDGADEYVIIVGTDPSILDNIDDIQTLKDMNGAGTVDANGDTDASILTSNSYCSERVEPAVTIVEGVSPTDTSFLLTDMHNGYEYFFVILAVSDTVYTPITEAVLNINYGTPDYEDRSSGWAVTSDLQGGDRLGRAVSISGNCIAAGAPFEDYAGDAIAAAGAVYVFEKSATDWIGREYAKLAAVDAAIGDHFGAAVAISGDYIIVGAPEDDDLGADSGSAYIYSRNSNTGTWELSAKLTASDGQAWDSFGYSVSISGDYAIVSAVNEDGAGDAKPGSGAAYIYERSESGTWSEKTQLRGQASWDYFGVSAAISGNYAVVGASAGGTPDTGTAYFYQRSESGTWSQMGDTGVTITASDATSGWFFGVSVAIKSTPELTAALIGSHLANAGAVANGGAAYVFELSGNSWSQVAKLTASDALSLSEFGQATSLDLPYAVVGASRMSGGPALDVVDAGAAYAFYRNESGTWSTNETTKFTAQENVETLDLLGRAVAISGDSIIVGADSKPADDVADLHYLAGGAYLF